MVDLGQKKVDLTICLFLFSPEFKTLQKLKLLTTNLHKKPNFLTLNIEFQYFNRYLRL